MLIIKSNLSFCNNQVIKSIYNNCLNKNNTNNLVITNLQINRFKLRKPIIKLKLYINSKTKNLNLIF